MPSLPAIRLAGGAEELTIPLVRAGSLLLVPARINGQDAGLFLIDTGFSSVEVSRETAERLKLPVLGAAVRVQSTTGDTSGEMVKLDELSIGPAGKSATVGPDLALKTETTEVDFLMGIKVAGAIGGSILQEMPYTLDFRAASLTFYRREKFEATAAARGGPSTLSQLILSRRRAPAILARVEGREGWFLLGTGHTGTGLIYPPFARQHSDVFDGKDKIRIAVGGLSGSASVDSVRLDAFEFAGTTVKGRRCAVQWNREKSDGIGDWCAGMAGADMLRDGRLTFDYAGRRMWAQWPAPETTDQMTQRLLAEAGGAGGKDFGGYTPLMQAASAGRGDVVHKLLEAGAGPNAETSMGVTALALAAEVGNDEAVTELLAKGAKVDPKLAMGAFTPLLFAAEEGHAGIVKALLAAGAEVNLANLGKETPLHRASAADRAEIVGILIASGADTEAKEKHELTPLMVAALEQQPRTIAALLRGGAQVNAVTSDGATALLFAATTGSSQTVKALLDGGADPNLRTVDGATALMVSTRGGDPEPIALLLARGADPKAADATGRTAADLALSGGNRDAWLLLLQAR